MKRREFITLLGSAAVAWPVAAHAQQTSMPIMGFLSNRSPGESASVVSAFRQGLGETGFVEGRNLAIAFRWAEGHYERLPALAAELVGLPVALVFSAGGPPTAFAAKAATSTIPIVFSAVGDPVEIGLVELTKELMPTIGVIDYLLNPSDQMSEIELKGALAAARVLGIELRVLRASSENELDTAFATVPKVGAGALVVSAEAFALTQRERIVALSARHGVAAVYAWREYVLAGGLMSYGTDLPESYRQAGIYAGRILKGEKPANLPVMQPTKFHLAVNLKTAKALGLDIPPTLLARADEVIE